MVALAVSRIEKSRNIRERLGMPIRSIRSYLRLPAAARAEYRRDRIGLLRRDPGIERALEASLNWLCRAQDNSASRDGGVASHFSLLKGWGTSYPETTGYIVPTMLAAAAWRKDEMLRQRAKRMVDWLVSLQFPEGGFQGGWMGTKRVVPVSFNTGQILLGLASAVREFGEQYREPMRKAADWLVATQDPDGCWRKYPTPLADAGDKSYEAQIAWGLLEAARLEPDKPYAESALAKVRWALGLQKENGWFEKCCFTSSSAPLTHTLGYALRAVLEAYRFTNDTALLAACIKTGDGLLSATRRDGFVPGRLYPDWRGAVPWACLTGTAQIACCWLILYQHTAFARYRDAAFKATRYLRRTVRIKGPADIRGGVKGSFPVYGDYCGFEYINWACKFFIDANLLEKTVGQA
jgi:rhamnogalacturonyl hydrolase YesR